jgi:hypothetical protein
LELRASRAAEAVAERLRTCGFEVADSVLAYASQGIIVTQTA